MQSSIDAHAYPATHMYDVASLRPRGPLRERLDVILGVCPTFFQADSFLDVGCSKGFFALKAARQSQYVLALDPDAPALAAWKPVCPANVRQMQGTFADLPTTFLYDMVWIGNGHHYLHREDPGGWVDRLLAIASKYVVIEGPTGGACPDLKTWSGVMEEHELLEALRPRLRLVMRAPSPTYTPGRAVWCFRTR